METAAGGRVRAGADFSGQKRFLFPLFGICNRHCIDQGTGVRVYNEMVKNMYEGLTLSVTVTYEDGTIEIVDVGFKAAEGSDDLEKVSDKVIVYVK